MILTSTAVDTLREDFTMCADTPYLTDPVVFRDILILEGYYFAYCIAKDGWDQVEAEARLDTFVQYRSMLLRYISPP